MAYDVQQKGQRGRMKKYHVMILMTEYKEKEKGIKSFIVYINQQLSILF